MAKSWGVECAVSWCVCLTKPESQYCAVHDSRGKAFKPGASGGGASVECDECDGTGACEDCDGEGTHHCEARYCDEQHECRSCDGTGDCAACKNGDDDPESFDSKYLAFAFDAGWLPPVLIEYPWESA